MPPCRPLHRCSGAGATARMGSGPADPGVDFDDAIAAPAAPSSTGALAALLTMSDAEAFGGSGGGLTRTQGYATQNRPPELAPYDAPEPVDSHFGALMTDAVGSTRQLALMRQDMAGFGAAGAFDRMTTAGGGPLSFGQVNL